MQWPGRTRRRIAIDDRADQPSGADLLHQRDRTLKRHNRGVDVGAALESGRGLGLQPEAFAGAADGCGLEVGALERHRPRRARHLGSGAAHDAGDGLRPPAVRDHEHVRLELALHAVERRDDLAGLGAPNPQLGARERREIEGVHGMPELHQHVVRDVHERADRADAGRQQAGDHPRRRARERDLGDRGRVARAQLGILERDFQPLGFARGRRRQRRRGARLRLGAAEGKTVRRRDLPREPDDAQAVGTVRRHFEVDDAVVLAGVARRLDRRDLEAAEPEPLGDLLGRRFHVDEIPDPRNQESHVAVSFHALLSARSGSLTS